MCGLCGVVYLDPRKPVEPAMLHRMARMMSHRGPDDEGYFVRPGVGLGFRRLAIIDLHGGSQPFSNEDGSITATGNGEIYNYDELRQDLEAAGHRFSTNSDIEVIVHLYEDHGVRCVDSLRGMFGFAIWDARHRRLLLARDRFGIKPLSYAVTPDALFFASEFKSILASGCVDRQVDSAAMRELFDLGFILAPKTLFTRIRRLPPAHYLVHEDGRLTIQRYWDLSFPPAAETQAPGSAQEWAEAVRVKLDEVVRLHLRSDVALGSYLSSGIDSSAVAQLMSRKVSYPVQTFSVAFDDPRYDEIGPNRLLTDFAGGPRRNLITTCKISDFDLLPKLIWHREDPSLSLGGIAHMLLARLASRHVKVVMTGEGSDEVFGGYPWYRVERMFEAFLRVPPLLRGFIARIPFVKTRWSRASRAFAAPAEMGLARYARILDGASEGNHDAIFAASFGHRGQRGAREEPPLRLPPAFRTWDRFAQLQYIEISSRLSDYITRTVDAASMAYGLEARVPFLDHEFVELCSQVPTGLKMRRLQEKHILRRALKDDLPPQILKRSKRGLAAPRWPWEGGLPDFVADALSESELAAKGHFDPRSVRDMLQRHRNGEARLARELLGVLSVQIWDDLFVRGCRSS